MLTTMQSTFIFMFAILGGALSCPGDYQMQIMACLGPLQSVMSGGPPDCGVINSALGCFRAIEQQCPGNQQVAAMFETMQLQNLERLCTAGVGGCPPMTEIAERLQTCSASFSGSGDCTSMREGISCMEELQSQCAQDPNSAQFFQSLPELKNAYEASCSASKCSVENPKRVLRKCQRRMTSSRTPYKAPAKRCRIIIEGLDCVSNLLEKCPSVAKGGMTPASLQQQKQSVVEHCIENGVNIQA